MEQIGQDVIALLTAADLAEKGSWPVAGGWMDQARPLVDGVRFFWSEDSFWKARAQNSE